MKIKPNRKNWAFKMKKPTKDEKITFFEVVGIEPQKSEKLFDTNDSFTGKQEIRHQ